MTATREQNYVGVFDGKVGYGRKPAVIVIDFTLAYTTPGSPFFAEGVVRAVRDTVPLLAAARAAGVPVIHTRVEYHPSGADGGWFVRKVPALRKMVAGEKLAQIDPAVAPLPDEVVLVTTRNGKETRIEIDMVDMFASGNRSKDPQMHAGDVIYVSRAPQYYIYGQVQRPGMYGVDRGMTVAQAIAKGGGLTLRGTDKGVRVSRRKSDGKLDAIEPRLDDPIRPDDLIFIRESIF